jgi:predicted RNA-binding protein with PIN domain
VSPDAIQQQFPNSRFIAQQGRGSTREAAEADGVAQIARYFSSEVYSHVLVYDAEYQQGSRTEVISLTEIETYTRSQLNLFSVRFVTDAYFDKRMREWFTVAYIDREEAWRIFHPTVRLCADTFNELFQTSENESGRFKKALQFITVQDYIRSAEFINVLEFGQLLHPARMNEAFSGVRTDMARLFQLSDTARRNAPVYIVVPDDFESMVTNAITDEFRKLGFPVASDRERATAICHVHITEGRQVRELGVFYHPSLRVVISSGDETLFSLSFTGERESAVRPDVAKRRAYQSLVDSIRENFRLGNL